MNLDEAWRETEAVLPETWYISNVRRRSPKGRYSASATVAYSDTGESMSGFGPTPAAALQALARRFTEPPFVPACGAPTPAGACALPDGHHPLSKHRAANVPADYQP